MPERDMPSRVAKPFLFLAKLLAWDREAWGKVKKWAMVAEVLKYRNDFMPRPKRPHSSWQDEWDEWAERTGSDLH